MSARRRSGVASTRVAMPVVIITSLYGAASTAALADARAATGIAELRDMPQTRERPLFTPSRRPPEPARPVPKVVEKLVPSPAPPTAPAPEPDQLVLTGIVSGQETQLAVLRNARTNEVHRMQRGEKLLGWSVDEIAPRSVVMRKDGKILRLELFPDAKR